MITESLEKELIKLSEVGFRELELRVNISKMLRQIVSNGFTFGEIEAATDITLDVLNKIKNMQFDISIREIAKLESFL